MHIKELVCIYLLNYDCLLIVVAVELSRRDDLFSIGYVLIYFLKGILPWQGLHGQNNEEKYEMILQKKLSTSLEELCVDLPGKLIIKRNEMIYYDLI